MTQDESAQLDHLLSLWHWWAGGEKASRGHNHRALVVGDCRGYGLQFESQLEQQDADNERLTCKTIDGEVRKMNEPYRAAIYADARNLVYGIAVWSSPRLPLDPNDRAIVVKVARQMIANTLIGLQIMDRG